MNSLVRYGEIGRGLDVLCSDIFNMVWEDPMFALTRNWKPTEIVEDKDSMTYEIELPRFTKEQVKVEAVNGTISVSARNEKTVYSKTFTTRDLELDKAEVKLENGVLSIKCPKKAEAKARVLQIK